MCVTLVMLIFKVQPAGRGWPCSKRINLNSDLFSICRQAEDVINFQITISAIFFFILSNAESTKVNILL